MEIKRHFSAYFTRRPIELGACGDHVDLWNADLPDARNILAHGHFPDLKTFTNLIGAASDRDPLSQEVAEDYWLGSDHTADIEKLCDEYLRNGKHQVVVEAIRKSYPDRKIQLTHMAQVMLVAEENMQIINGCMVAGAEVVKVGADGKISVKREWVSAKAGGGYEITTAEERVGLTEELRHNLKVGEKIAVHQGQMATKLTDEQATKLKKYNTEVVTTF